MNKECLKTGIGYSTASSVLLGFGMALLVVVEKYESNESVLSLFLSSAALWLVLGLVFGFIGAVVIGAPLALALEKIGLFKPYVLPAVGGGAGYILGGFAWVTREQNPYIQIMFAIYGLVGAFAFWWGASSNKPSQPTLIIPR